MALANVQPSCTYEHISIQLNQKQMRDRGGGVGAGGSVIHTGQDRGGQDRTGTTAQLGT